jgi:pyruvate,orthophosphate dikinase
MHHASGILTSRGGMTSHAAVVARGMGKPCISGAPIKIDPQSQTVKIGELTIGKDDYITIDGSSGNIILGKTELIAQKLPPEFDIFMDWVDETRTMKVRANAENVLDIQNAIKFGAEGIGLCRTEHMLFEKNRLNLIRKIVIESSQERKIQFIDELFILHKQDFKDIFKLVGGLPINIRLLDPPLHEFLPFEDFEKIAKDLDIDQAELEQKIESIAEKNPMLGHRGCRLGVTLPEIYQMQIKAIIEAAIETKKEESNSFELEIMLPFIATLKELEILIEQIQQTAKILQDTHNKTIDYKIGIMIELPRAAIIAEKLAPLVRYFSFGTNDLTQMTYGLSRDDMPHFAVSYKDQGIFVNDPFSVLDEEGVGELIKLAAKKGRSVNSDISLSICGEHGGDPKSIKFFNSVGLNYVSCSPFRIIIAKLAAAQANL